jgi:hypothetical protein
VPKEAESRRTQPGAPTKACRHCFNRRNNPCRSMRNYEALCQAHRFPCCPRVVVRQLDIIKVQSVVGPEQDQTKQEDRHPGCRSTSRCWRLTTTLCVSDMPSLVMLYAQLLTPSATQHRQHSTAAGTCVACKQLAATASWSTGSPVHTPFPAAPCSCCCNDVWVQCIHLHGLDAAHVLCSNNRRATRGDTSNHEGTGAGVVLGSTHSRCTVIHALSCA